MSEIYTIRSSNPLDTAIIRQLVPGGHQRTITSAGIVHGPTLLPGQTASLRNAGGLCVDLRRHIRGTAYVTDESGAHVPETAWRAGLAEGRGQLR